MAAETDLSGRFGYSFPNQNLKCAVGVIRQSYATFVFLHCKSDFCKTFSDLNHFTVVWVICRHTLWILISLYWNSFLDTSRCLTSGIQELNSSEKLQIIIIPHRLTEISLFYKFLSRKTNFGYGGEKCFFYECEKGHPPCLPLFIPLLCLFSSIR